MIRGAVNYQERYRYSGLIYRATNLSNGKTYFGQTVESLAERRSKHWNDARRGNGTYFSRALLKYGMSGFHWEIVCRVMASDVAIIKTCLDSLERYFIGESESTKREVGYNRTMGGGGCFGFSPSEETRQRQRLAKLGVPRSIEAREAVGRGHLGIKHTEEAKRKIRLAKLGARNPMFGKPHSPEHRAKLSQRLRERIVADKTRRLLSENAKKMWQRRKAL